ncbi:hypothetical protein C0992_003401 [Termitomyces sp. T32_za158]|nr:hypothetical protein C0992_003401 [Termitomyces sp. T32_za158]
MSYNSFPISCPPFQAQQFYAQAPQFQPQAQAQASYIQAPPPTSQPQTFYFLAQSPELHQQAPCTHAQPPYIQAQPPQLQAQPQYIQTQPPIQAQPHYIQTQPPIQAQAPPFQSQPVYYQSQPSQFQAQPSQFQAQPPQFQAQPPQFIPYESRAPHTRDPHTHRHHLQRDRDRDHKERGHTHTRAHASRAPYQRATAEASDVDEDEHVDEEYRSRYHPVPPTPFDPLSCFRQNLVPIDVCSERGSVFERDDEEQGEEEEEYKEEDRDEDGGHAADDEDDGGSVVSGGGAPVPPPQPESTPHDKKPHKRVFIEEIDEDIPGLTLKTQDAAGSKPLPPTPAPMPMPRKSSLRTRGASKRLAPSLQKKPSFALPRKQQPAPAAPAPAPAPPAPAPPAQAPPSPTLLSSNLLSSKILTKISLNSSTITYIKIEPPLSPSTCFQILTRAPTLRALCATLGPAPPSPSSSYAFWNGELRTHPLESLVLNIHTNPRPLLSTLSLPSLARLTLDARHGDFSRSDSLGLHRLLVNSKCALRTLVLSDVYPSRTELMRCLRDPACAKLENLVVRATLPRETVVPYVRRAIGSDTVKDLTDALPVSVGVGPGPGAEPGAGAGADADADADALPPLLCPQLRGIELSYCNCTPEDLVALAKARVARGSLELRYAFAGRAGGPRAAALASELKALQEAESTTVKFRFRESQVQLIGENGEDGR